MNGRIVKKIRKSVNSKANEKVNDVFDCLNKLPFKKRFLLAIKLIFGKV